MRSWAQSRAVEARRVEGGSGGSGVGSWQRRLPRSKVGGMGFVTVMELGRGELVGVEWVDLWGGGAYSLFGCEALGGMLRSLEDVPCGTSMVEFSDMMVIVSRVGKLR